MIWVVLYFHEEQKSIYNVELWESQWLPKGESFVFLNRKYIFDNLSLLTNKAWWGGENVAKIDNVKLRSAREELCLTQEQLAEKANMSERYLRYFESGESNPSALLLYSISKALDKRIDYFINEERGE